ncbi:acetyltransferase-like isoleucine patch superfamily enzyme [Nitrobacteraceae bacterium AZCC 1564]
MILEVVSGGLPRERKVGSRVVKAIHSAREIEQDPQFELDMAAHLRKRLRREHLHEAFSRYANGASYIDEVMRRVCLRALVRKLGTGAEIRRGVSLIHPETFEIGDGAFIGEHTIIQGHFDGRFVTGKGVWIGPQSYFDARDLVLEDYVGWGPGAKVLGSEHTGMPIDLPFIQTNLKIAPVRICEWADIGVNSVILPGITVGRGAIVGAGAVVTRDVPEFSTVAGVPARVIGRRKKHDVERIQASGRS